ncbi:MAG TPA: hypothetical protein VEX86_19655 [Longimicrobium sp.]|nr:hypothetical protein [Longimicrobium sp.]
MLTPNTQRRLVFHGSVILLIGLFCGIPSVVEVSAGSGRMWQGAHSALLILGVWLIATAAVLPLLLLERREAIGLRVSLLLMAYSFMVAVIVQASTGERVFGPGPSPLNMLVFAANILAVLGTFLAASLTALGAWNALRASRTSPAATPGLTSAGTQR